MVDTGRNLFCEAGWGVSANAVVTVVEVCLGCPSSFREASPDEEQRYGVTW